MVLDLFTQFDKLFHCRCMLFLCVFLFNGDWSKVLSSYTWTSILHHFVYMGTLNENHFSMRVTVIAMKQRSNEEKKKRQNKPQKRILVSKIFGCFHVYYVVKWTCAMHTHNNSTEDSNMSKILTGISFQLWVFRKMIFQLIFPFVLRRQK